MMVIPLIYVVQTVIIMNTVLLGSNSRNISDGGEMNEIINTIYAFVFPGLMCIGLIYGSALYMTTLVQDRNNQLRYLLNFAGMKPLAYFIGITLSDLFIIMYTMIVFIITAYVMDIQPLINQMIYFAINLACFGFSFVNLCNLVALPFKDATKATKLTQVLMFVFQAISILAANTVI